MSKKVYLTFDIETIVSKLSYNPTYHASVFLGGMIIANELKKRNLKGTFYISLSPKCKEISFPEYIDSVKLLVHSLKSFDNIRIEPHIHAYKLPVSFETLKDEFSKYNKNQQKELLAWSKNFFEEEGISVNNFRPGGYNVNDSYYEALSESGFKTSSILHKDNDVVNIDLLTGSTQEYPPYQTEQGITEYPVTSVKVKSVKPGVTEIINLSPDFLTIESTKEYIEKLTYININFHSFSMFNNRLARENHKNQLGNNIKFLFFEKWINKILRSTEVETINHNTLFAKEFIKWVDFIAEKDYNTYFIGE
ncbi:hypothetical protein [uncultured Aquimarina sp.]|uniref:hypothetical protein n=1 Tax=uncultured Aquimarina sp. TaxID=575652 RepID=UPI00260FDB1E|nr:hypothetical protein [uncultured Aquimarina sp.]